MKPSRISFLVLLVSSIVVTSAFAKQVEISGKYCYQYGDSESLMMAKKISYAMALRKAIETYKTFVTSISIIEDFQMKKDLIETIASGYVDNVKVIDQDVQGRTVCTSLVGYVNPDAVKSIISRKVEKIKHPKKSESTVVAEGKYIRILNYKRIGNEVSMFGNQVSILYQAKKYLYSDYELTIMINCFDKDGYPMEGEKVRAEKRLYTGEIRRLTVRIPSGTASFEIKPYKD
jgi:hypothetical protein